MNGRVGALTATPVAYRPEAKPLPAVKIHLGDGWGCAVLADRSSYCWESPASDLGSGGPILAQHVAWLDDKRTSSGPDRICSRDLDGARCFRGPEFIRNRESLAQEPRDRASDDTSWALTLTGWKSTLIDPTPVRHGAFRGCSEGLCWGPRNAPPGASSELRICHHNELAAPCEVAGSAELAAFYELGINGPTMIGDLFGCSRTHRGLLCIGASRDGLFGTQAACPPQLLSAWPTATGTVAAPNARCSRTPTPLKGGPTFGNNESAGPRGVCVEELTSRLNGLQGLWTEANWPKLECFGAVWLPKLALSQVQVGLGDEPAACGIDRQGQVHCWGARYSERGRPARPIEFAIPTGPAMVVGVAGPFHARCGFNRNCGRNAEKFPPCAQGVPSRTVHGVFDDPKSLEGQVLTVRGELGVANISGGESAIVCEGGQGSFCCGSGSAQIAVRDESSQLIIEGLTCTGDISRLCCNRAPLGQPVLVSGRLTWRGWVEGLREVWTLAAATVCEVNLPNE